MTITTVFNPPLSTDSPAVFAVKAHDTMAKLNPFAAELNALTVEVNGELLALDEAVQQAVEVDIPAAVALVDTAVAVTAAGSATAAKVAAEAARDASFVTGPKYATEALGRAAVADGATFLVQGSGDVAAFEYRRTNSGLSVLIADYPSKAAYNALADRQKLKADVQIGKNLFNPADPDVVTGYYVVSGTGALATSAGNTVTGFIPVVGGSTYMKSIFNGANETSTFAFFDSSRNYISGGTGGILAAPANAAYVRASPSTSNLGTFQVELGSAATKYAPYTPKIATALLNDGSLTELKHAMNAIGYRHTQFLQPVKNLHNPADPDVVLGYFVSGIDGGLSANAGYNTTGFIPVTGGTSYRLSYGNQIAWYDASKSFISGVVGIGGAATTQTAPASAVYLRVMVLTTAWAAFQVETGTASTPWAPFQLKLTGPGGAQAVATPADNSVTPAKVTFLTPGKNKFNLAASDVVIGSFVNADSGALQVSASYNCTGFIPVIAGTAYTLSYKHQIAWFNADKAYISGSSTIGTGKTQTAPAGAAFLRCTVLATEWSFFQVEVGSAQTGFESYGYILKDASGLPVRLEASASESDYLAVPAKYYIPVGKELAIYHENVTRDYANYRGRTSIALTGAKQTGPATKLTPTSGQVGATIAGTATIADTDYEVLSVSAFSVIVSDAAKTTAVTVQNIGDSNTGRSTWTNVITGSAANTNLSFVGLLTSSAGVPCEGRSGWAMDSYFTVDHYNAPSPFMQPVNAGYFYYGMTSFWINVNSATPTFGENYGSNKLLFSASTGRKLAPNVGDIMADAGAYIQWNGSAWAAINSATFGGFALNYGKYRAAWGIAAPNIVQVLLGTNDFAGATLANMPTYYPTFKARYDTLIESIKADLPAVKIIVGIPMTSGRQGRHGTLESEKRKRGYYLLAKYLMRDYGGRESESLYVLDFHSTLDRFYGYENVAEKPYADYSGTAGDDLYKGDNVHPSPDGFKQMGNVYMGLIQHLR